MNFHKIATLLEQLAQEFRDIAPEADKPSKVVEAIAKSTDARLDGVKPSEVKLEDLQRMGKSLIQDGRADELKVLLERLKLKSLSTAPKERYTEIYANLNSL